MLSKKKLLSIHELQVGMISASNINFEDKVLLADGLTITESILHKLKHIYIIDKVEVYSDIDYSESLIHKDKTVKEIENTFTQFSSYLETIFTYMSTLRAPGIEEVRIFSKKIQDKFQSVGSVIRDIIFYGSVNDPIYRHSVNVTAISFILGKWLDLDEKDLNLLTYAAILHDFGKIKLDKDLLNKKGRLNAKDFEIYKTHPTIGYHIVKQIPFLDASVSLAVLMHHERMDGSGYPLQVEGDKIPKFAKIIAIADLFDEVSSNRYAGHIRGPFEALRVIEEQGFRKLDPNYCNVFLSHIVNYYMGESVLLSNDRPYKIIQVQLNNLTQPLLVDEDGFVDLSKEKELYIKNLII